LLAFISYTCHIIYLSMFI